MSTQVFIPIDNVYISECYYNQNFFGSNSLFCGQFDGAGDIYRSLLRFNLGSIPASCTIIEAKLKLFVYRNDAPAVSRQINVFQALGNFTEEVVTYASQPLKQVSPAASLTVSSEWNSYLEFDIKDLVKGWYTGIIPNNGVVITGLETADALLGFRSKEFNNSSNWPLLEVKYVTGVMEEYPVENVVTGDVWVGSNPIPLGSRTVSIAVVNTGDTNDAAVQMEISPNGITWAWAPYLLTSGVFIITPLPASGYLGDSTIIFQTTGYTGAYVRISYTRRTGHGPTTLSIYPSAVEE